MTGKQLLQQNSTTSRSTQTTNPRTKSGEFVGSIGSPTEIDDDDINSLRARPRHLTHIIACSHPGDTAGTSGGYDIFDGDTKVCHVSWSCPLGRGVTNAMDIVDLDEDYEVECKGASLEPGPLGHVSISVRDSTGH